MNEREQALMLVTSTIGELMEFWGFKRSAGIIWATLYIEGESLSQEEIVIRTGLSTGSVSMTCSELESYGIINKDLISTDRKRRYKSETEIGKMVRNVIRTRELKKIQDAMINIEKAVDLLHESRKSLKARDHQNILSLITRLESLLSKAKLVETALKSVYSWQNPQSILEIMKKS